MRIVLLFRYLLITVNGLMRSSQFEFIGTEVIWELQPFFLLEGSGTFIYAWIGLYLFFVIILVVKISPKIGGRVRVIS